MPDVAEDAVGHQRGSLLKGQQLGFPGALTDRFPPALERAHSQHQRNQAENEQYPRNTLVPRKWIPEPVFEVEDKQGGDEFPSEESVKTMRARFQERLSRDDGEYAGKRKKSDDFEAADFHKSYSIPECRTRIFWLLSCNRLLLRFSLARSVSIAEGKNDNKSDSTMTTLQDAGDKKSWA